MKKVLCFSLGLFACSILFATGYKDSMKEGISKIRKGDRAAALICFRQAYSQAKTQSEKVASVLQCSLAMPDSACDKALDMLLKFRKENPKLSPQNDAFLHLRIGVLQVHLKKYKEGEESLYYARSLKKLSDRDRLLVCDMLSYALLQNKKYEKSLKILSEWENIDVITPNDYSRCLTRKAGILGALRRFDEAYRTGIEAAEIKDSSIINQALAWQMLSYIAFANEKNYPKAKKYSEKCKEVSKGKTGFNPVLHTKIEKTFNSMK